MLVSKQACTLFLLQAPQHFAFLFVFISKYSSRCSSVPNLLGNDREAMNVHVLIGGGLAEEEGEVGLRQLGWGRCRVLSAVLKTGRLMLIFPLLPTWIPFPEGLRNCICLNSEQLEDLQTAVFEINVCWINGILPPVPPTPPSLFHSLYLWSLQIPIVPKSVFQTRNLGYSDFENHMKQRQPLPEESVVEQTGHSRGWGLHPFLLCILSGQHRPGTERGAQGILNWSLPSPQKAKVKEGITEVQIYQSMWDLIYAHM